MSISNQVRSSSSEFSTVIFDEPPSLRNPASQIKTPEESSLFSENVAFIKCMKAIYEREKDHIEFK